MLKYKQQPYNSIWISADTQEELGLTFMRFQEFYESANPKFRNSIFTLGQLRHWYSENYGTNSYHKDWTGFNIPSRVLNPFKAGLFDPLTEEENNLLELLKYRQDSFYIIGAQDTATLRHELSHALYDYNIKYRNTINSIVSRYDKQLTKAKTYILNKGYTKEVINDELQAYITDNEDEFLKANIPTKIINLINQTYEKYRADA